ncbi:cyclic nucleotide-binding domain-containing protein, partial [Pyxidicoccus fallax]|nr:cyclic nucleotide-binding domain-containing protein [Pyxidicoccus fallax]NPC87117.1 cyclic nucleotide-binding domain-containing protein [Pyxidicoccus fallax]
MSHLATHLRSLFASKQSPAREGTREAPSPESPPTARRVSRPAPLPVWPRLYAPGAMVVHEGDPGESMFLITGGRVAVMRQGEG